MRAELRCRGTRCDRSMFGPVGRLGLWAFMVALFGLLFLWIKVSFFYYNTSFTSLGWQYGNRKLTEPWKVAQGRLRVRPLTPDPRGFGPLTTETAGQSDVGRRHRQGDHRCRTLQYVMLFLFLISMKKKYFLINCKRMHNVWTSCIF